MRENEELEQNAELFKELHYGKGEETGGMLLLVSSFIRINLFRDTKG